MFNYARRIGNAVKIGMDVTDPQTSPKRKKHQTAAAIGGAIYGRDEAVIEDLWSRYAGPDKRAAYAIDVAIKRELHPHIVYGVDWLRANDDVLKFFHILMTDTARADKHCDLIIKMRYGNDPALQTLPGTESHI